METAVARKKKPDAERQYSVETTIILTGAVATVTARSADEAREKIDAGRWDDLDYSGASLVDCSITGRVQEEE